MTYVGLQVKANDYWNLPRARQNFTSLVLISLIITTTVWSNSYYLLFDGGTVIVSSACRSEKGGAELDFKPRISATTHTSWLKDLELHSLPSVLLSYDVNSIQKLRKKMEKLIQEMKRMKEQGKGRREVHVRQGAIKTWTIASGPWGNS